MTGDSVGLSHRESEGDGEVGGAFNNQNLGLAQLISYLQNPSSSPNQGLCSYAEQVGHAV